MLASSSLYAVGLLGSAPPLTGCTSAEALASLVWAQSLQWGSVSRWK